MRAEHNWEDEIGKRLRQHEAMPPPLAWDKIRKEIRPRQRFRWWLWLPVLLVMLISLPLAYRQLQPEPAGVLPARRPQPATGSATAGLPAEKPATAPLAAAPSKDMAHVAGPAGAPAAFPETTPHEAAPVNRPVARGAAPPHTTAALLPANGPAKKNRKKAYGPPAAALAEATPPGRQVKLHLINEHSRREPAGPARQHPEANSTEKAETGAGKAFAGTGSAPPNAAGSIPEAGSAASGGTTSTSSGISSGHTVAAVPVKTHPDAEAEAGIMPADPVLAAGRPDQPADSAALKTIADNKALAPDTAMAAKEESSEENKSRRWALSAYAIPQMAFQRIQANTEDDIMLLRLDNRNQLSGDRLGFEAGFRGHYQLGNRWNLEAGVHLARLQQNTRFTTTLPGADSVVVSQDTNGEVTMQMFNREQNQEFASKHWLGGLYLGGSYAVSGRVQLTGGVGSSWILATETNQADLAATKGRLNPYLSGGLRYQVPVSNRLTLQAGPVAQYYLRPMQAKTSFCGGKPVTFGFSFGLKMDHKR